MNVGIVSHPPTAHEADKMIVAGLTDLRVDVTHGMTDDEIRGAARRCRDSGLELFMSVTAHGVEDVGLFSNHAVHAWQLFREEGCSPQQIGLGNEQNLAYMQAWEKKPLKYGDACVSAYEALRADGYAGTIYAGSVSSFGVSPWAKWLSRLGRSLPGLDYLEAMNWGRMPVDMGCDPHLYDPINPPPGHKSFQDAWDRLRAIIGFRPVLIGEIGEVDHTQSAKEAARKLKDTLTLLSQPARAVQCAYVYVWTEAHGPGELHYAVTEPDGQWKPQTYAIQEWTAAHGAA